MQSEFIKSPLNYIGGKYKILDQIIPLFPDDIETFVEPFCGGYNVGINVQAKNYIAMDINSHLIEVFDYFKDNSIKTIQGSIYSLISEYSLSLENREGYNSLRARYNITKNPIELFVLTCFSFNHQIRFNNNLQFNTPFGLNRSSYNQKIEMNLTSFVERIHVQNVIFKSINFMDFQYDTLNEKSLVYCDPPYLITTGSYNDGKRGFGDWKEDNERKLLELLDSLNDRGVKFALSNVIEHMGQTNETLKKWASKYNMHFLVCDYNNSNYHSKAKEHKTIEVLITNY